MARHAVPELIDVARWEGKVAVLLCEHLRLARADTDVLLNGVAEPEEIAEVSVDTLLDLFRRCGNPTGLEGTSIGSESKDHTHGYVGVVV
jgi:hypothetical protein